MALFSRSKLLIFGVFFIFALVPVASPTSFVNVAYADEGEGDAEGTGGTGAGSGGVGDINDGTTGSPSPSFDFLTVTTSCNENGTADASISFFFELYPPYHVLSMQILKDGAVVHTLGSYGATNPEGITSLDMHQPGISFTNFAAGSTYEVQVGDLAADFINTDTGPEINRWNFSQVASRTFGPLNCPAADLVGLQTAIYGYAVNDTRTVTPGALQFNSSLGNYGNANAGAFDVQVEVKNAAGTAGYSKFSSKFRSSGFSAYTSGWLAPIAFDGSALVPGGSYLARVCVDVDGEVPESNGNNNCGEWDSFYVATTPVQLTNWTTYCTGAGNANPANDWKYWQWADFSDGRHYQYYAPGDVNCRPAPVQLTNWTTYCTGAGNANPANDWKYWQWADFSDGRHYQYYAPGDVNCRPAPVQLTNWTTYCTGAGNANPANDWKYWQWADFSDGRHYQYYAPGDVNCRPAPTQPPTVTGSCNANGTVGTYSWGASARATGYALRYAPANGSCGTGWVLNAAYNECDIDTYSNNLGPVTFPTTPGTSYSVWVHGTNSSGWSNATGSTFTCPLLRPDLTATEVTNGTVALNTSVTFSSVVTNGGAASTGAGFNNLFEIYRGATPPTDFAQITPTYLRPTTAALAQGGTVTITAAHTFDAYATYQVRACADTNASNVGAITESNESNNCGPWKKIELVAACTTSGSSCSASNACNYATGTYDASCTCSATVPPVPPTFGEVCPSIPATNICGMSGTGTILCNGTCSAVTPPDTLCLPTVTLSADPTRVRKNTSTKLTWTSSAATSCSLTGQNGFSSTALSGTAIDSTSLDAQTTFTLTCSNAYGSKSASVLVNLIPAYIEQ